MNSRELKFWRRYLREDSKKWPTTMKEMPVEQWPERRQKNLFMVWRSRSFLVQGFREDGEVIRLSINRAELDNAGRWKDGITWEELQRIKAECGYGERVAFEIFPRDRDVVNVANLRHLWIPANPPRFGWVKAGPFAESALVSHGTESRETDPSLI